MTTTDRMLKIEVLPQTKTIEIYRGNVLEISFDDLSFETGNVQQMASILADLFSREYDSIAVRTTYFRGLEQRRETAS